MHPDLFPDGLPACRLDFVSICHLGATSPVDRWTASPDWPSLALQPYYRGRECPRDACGALRRRKPDAYSSIKQSAGSIAGDAVGFCLPFDFCSVPRHYDRRPRSAGCFRACFRVQCGFKTLGCSVQPCRDPASLDGQAFGVVKWALQLVLQSNQCHWVAMLTARSMATSPLLALHPTRFPMG